MKNISVMKAKPTILKIPLLALYTMISYLNTREVYLIFATVCREFREITRTSKEIPINLIRVMAGVSDETARLLSSFKLPTLIGLLKSIHTDSIELPYHGIKTDGGCYSHNAQYFMDRIFQLRYGGQNDAYSSLVGDEFHVEGALALEYFDSKTLLYKLAINDGVNDKLFEAYELYEEKSKTDIQDTLTKAAVSSDRNNIEISYFPLDEISSVITSIEVRRPHFFGCLTKTVILFCSDERIDFADPLLKAFSGASTKTQLIALYNKHNDRLPYIEATNIIGLKKYARDRYYDPIIEPANTTEVVLFSNKTNFKVKVVAWMRIIPATLRKAKIYLKERNYFSGKFVVGKLLGRDQFDDEEDANLVLKSISLKGVLLTQNEVLASALKSFARITSIWDHF